MRFTYGDEPWGRALGLKDRFSSLEVGVRATAAAVKLSCVNRKIFRTPMAHSI
jgi:hypothetical protein